MVGALREARERGLLRVAHLTHLRCEVSHPRVLELFHDYVDGDDVRLVSLMDHTPGQRQFTRMDKYREYYKGKHGMTDAELDRLTAARMERSEKFSARHRAAIARECRARGVVLASHDDATPEHVEEAVAAAVARVLLRRYGVVFRRLLDNEPRTLPWWQLVRALRRMEARGDVRGGRFVTGVSGEQFALPEAVGQLRRIRRSAPSGRPVAVSAADPLNLTGILTPGPRIAKSTRNRVVYRDGVPVAAHEGGAFVRLGDYEDAVANLVERAARIGSLPPALRSYMGRKRRRSVPSGSSRTTSQPTGG
jgi:hypothetical protein